MQAQPSSRRSIGTGSLYPRKDRSGAESWYGHWRDSEGRQVKRVIGLKRKRGTREGLTKGEAESALREKMGSAATATQRRDPLAFEEVGRRYIGACRERSLKPSTMEGYESALAAHLEPYFRNRDITNITVEDVEGFIRHLLGLGKAPKTVKNYLGVLYSILDLAARKKWIASNPCSEIESTPRVAPQVDIRFLDETELEALLRAEQDDELGRVLRVMYLTAALTGLRQGELLGLRWRDVDWQARQVRVRRAYVRGEFGTPKSTRSARSVPLHDRVGAELDRLHQASAFKSDDDLVFGHPVLGHPLDRSKVLKRFKAAVKAAGVGQFKDVVRGGKVERKPLTRFHDLRHTFGTRVAASGKVPMRTHQQWMGHSSPKTTQIYADYAPSAHESDWINSAFGGETATSLLPPGPVAAAA